MYRRASLTVMLLSFCLSTVAAAEGPITTGTLVGQMVDLVRLGDFPAPSYQTVQFSSHDHRSTVPGGPDWFANSDGFGGEPIPNFEAVLDQPDAQGNGRYLICDVPGPGAIVRMWTAAIEGQVRVFLDANPDPLFDGPAQEFLQEPYRRFAAAAKLDVEPLVGTFRQRDACYFPIPFAKRCRIEWLGNVKKIHFYEVQVRRYAPDAQVVTFSPKDLESAAATVQRVTRILADPQGQWQYQSHREPQKFTAAVAPGQVVEAVSLEGPLAIERLTLQLKAGDSDRALRQTVLQIVFDGHPRGQVQCPVGDFFGAGPGINPFNSVPLTVRSDGEMTCRYVMPFARCCKILLQNLGPEPVDVSGSLLALNYNWDNSRSMHFRAHWRVNHGLVAEGGGGAQDLPFLVARGSGVYVGTAIMLLNPNPVPTPYGNWWGEGDEKIFVDEDVQPSTFGTGSEDYFNYSWSSPDIFRYPYCGQPRNDGPANRGFVVNQRWHVMDALPFQKQIAFYMELYSHERTPNFSYARLAYHYGRPGITDDHVGLTSEDVRWLQLPENWQPAARMGARGSTFFQAEDLLAKKEAMDFVSDNLWAGGKLMVWTPAKIDDTLEFTLPVKEAGRYALHLTTALTPHSGVIAAQLDSQPLRLSADSANLDLRSDYRTLSRTASTPVLDLTAGEHRLTIRWLGAGTQPEQPPGKNTVGIDFVWLQRR